MCPIPLWLSWFLAASAPAIPLDLDYLPDGRCIGRQPIVMVEVVELKTDGQRRAVCRVRVTDVIRGPQNLLGLKMSEYTLKDNEPLLKIGDVGLWRLPAGSGGPVLPESVLWKRGTDDFVKDVELAVTVATLDKQSPQEQCREVRKWLQSPRPLVANWAVGALRWDWSPQATHLLAELGTNPPNWLTTHSTLDQVLCYRLGEKWILGEDRRKLLLSCVEANTAESQVVLALAQGEFDHADQPEETRIKLHRDWQGRYTPDLAVELLLAAARRKSLTAENRVGLIQAAVPGVRLGAKLDPILELLMSEFGNGKANAYTLAALAMLVHYSAGDTHSKPNPLSAAQIANLRKLAEQQQDPDVKNGITALANAAALAAANAGKK
jgi:hypothetical protein